MRIKCLVLLTILHFRYWHLRVSAINLNPASNSLESKILGDVYQANMKSDLKPCVNFYDYACHYWEKNNPRPLFEYTWHQEDVMQYRTFEILKNHIEKMKSDKSHQSITKVKNLYNECMQQPSMERLDAKSIKNIMSKNFKWAMLYSKNNQPLIDLPWKVDNTYIQLTGESAFFDNRIIFDIKSGFGLITELSALLSPYGILHRYSSWAAEGKEKIELEHYKSFLGAMIKNVAPRPSDLSWDLIERDLLNVILFREKLRLAITLTAVKPVIRDIKKLQEEYNLLRPQEVASMNWLEQINALYKKSKYPPSHEINLQSKVHVDIAYIQNLVNVLKSTDKRVIVNHIHLYFLERHFKFDVEMLKHLEQCVSRYPQKTGSFRRDSPKWKKCIAGNNLRYTLGNIYLETFFKESSSISVKKLLNHAKELLIKEIGNCKWIELDTKQSSISKLRNLQGIIGYPDYDLLTKYNESQKNPIIVDALYNPNLNYIAITAANLQWPIYSPNLPYVIDYGATVSMLAHELFHTMDQIGITEKCARGLYKCWPINMRIKFADHAKCFEDQFKEFREQQIKIYNLHLYNATISTLNEDLADVIGLKLAYKGYKVKLLENNNVCPILPQFKKFTCDQLFFIAYANTHCYSTTHKGRENDLNEDTHSLREVRVNGAVGNMKEFSDAFGCKPTDPLNLKNRCDLWE